MERGQLFFRASREQKKTLGPPWKESSKEDLYVRIKPGPKNPKKGRAQAIPREKKQVFK